MMGDSSATFGEKESVYQTINSKQSVSMANSSKDSDEELSYSKRRRQSKTKRTQDMKKLMMVPSL